MTVKFGEIWKIQKCPLQPSCLTGVQQRPRKASRTGPITSHINIYNASSGVQCRLVQTVSKWIFDFTIEKRKKNQMLTGLRSRRTAAAARWKGQWWKCVTTCFFSTRRFPDMSLLSCYLCFDVRVTFLLAVFWMLMKLTWNEIEREREKQDFRYSKLTR